MASPPATCCPPHKLSHLGQGAPPPRPPAGMAGREWLTPPEPPNPHQPQTLLHPDPPPTSPLSPSPPSPAPHCPPMSPLPPSPPLLPSPPAQPSPPLTPNIRIVPQPLVTPQPPHCPQPPPAPLTRDQQCGGGPGQGVQHRVERGPVPQPEPPHGFRGAPGAAAEVKGGVDPHLQVLRLLQEEGQPWGRRVMVKGVLGTPMGAPHPWVLPLTCQL